MTRAFVQQQSGPRDQLTWWLALLAGAVALFGIAMSQYF